MGRGERRKRCRSPLGAIVRGAIAGAAGTAAMDGAQYAQYRRGGGTRPFVAWETSEGLDDWDSAPAPAKLAKRLFEGMAQRELKPDKARLANNATHWATGIGWGAAYGVLAGSLGTRRVRYGLLWGAIVWASSYVVLPAFGLYKPIWEYDAPTLAKDLSIHLAYGVTTAAAFRVLAGPSRDPDQDVH
ncbi:MAG TPA: hypothetical protein VJ010_10525 [Actinomycetota bacterium]|nr:hypothetical protein [Actinomycetota bacterium]